MVVYWIYITENNPLSCLFTPLSFVNQPPTNSTWQIYEGSVIIDKFYHSFLIHLIHQIHDQSLGKLTIVIHSQHSYQAEKMNLC